MPTVRLRLSDDDLLPALLCVALAALACLTPAQNDTWWHLRSGQQMWQTGWFLLTEPFSHSAYGGELHNHWWASQLAFYGLHSLGGPFLLSLFAGACAFAAVLGSYRLLRGPWELRVGLFAWLIVATAPEWAVRPQVVSLALLVLAIHLVVRNRAEWLPLLCVVWANTHGMVVFGVAVSAALAADALLWTPTERKRAAAIAAACAAAPLISPLGLSYWPQVLQTVSVSRELQIQEYRLPFTTADFPFWLGLAAFAIVLIQRRRVVRELPRADRVLVLVALLLAVAALTASRNIAFFAVVAAPALSRLWPMADIGRRRAPTPAGVLGLALTAVALFAAAATVAVRWRDGGTHLGWRPMSAATIDAVRRCPGTLFNEMTDGGFLMWALPHRRVFVDSRMEAYPVRLLHQSREADVHGKYAALFRDYGIRCAVTATDSVLRQRLARDPSMTIMHSDAGHTVFRRSTVLSATRHEPPDGR
jgi:hypothetical protein